jgi:SAM-dependent methyltransferase
VRDDGWVTAARDSYDRIATRYDDLTRGALDRLPFERAMLDLFTQRVRTSGGGLVVDAGCGPGWITGHLARLGVDMCGLDVSPALVDIARANEPDVAFSVGSITDLPFEENALAGVVCWYVLHHVPDDALPDVLAEFARVLAPGGHVLVGGHTGEGSYQKTEGYGGIRMNVLVNRRSTDAMAGLLRRAGLEVDAQVSLGRDATSGTGIVFASKVNAVVRRSA